jgi:tRNA A-37 threonylcarbamoyl transferase component Bud32
VDKRYELFCLADPLFYDSPSSSRAAKQEFAVASRPLPAGWTRTSLGEWQVQVPPGDPVPGQGWKIHVSAGQDNAERVLEEVFDYCVPRRISFKFLRGPLALHVRNAKYAPRGSSGKLAAIYPADDESCARILAELDSIVGGEPGPYILSDLRYARGPLYVRYGAFLQQHCQAAGGELVPAVRDNTGRLVPDVRGPVFTVPDWLELPSFLAPHLAARNAVTVQDLPYRIEQALHFSNGGGVYLGTDSATGERVVLKEARPHAGLSADGADAVTRLRHEHDILRQLSGLGVVPGARGYLEAGEHHFLVMDHIDGAPLNSLYAYRHPLIAAEPDPDSIAGYTSWAVGICARVERAVDAIHARGIVLNDLHMFNVMVRPDDSVVLIDFEAAARIGDGGRPTLGNPGFLAPRDRTGFDIDFYSLGCVKLAMFLPLTTLFALDLGKAAHIAEVIAESFPVPPGFLDSALSDISGPRSGRTRGRHAADEPVVDQPVVDQPVVDQPVVDQHADPQWPATADQPGWELARQYLVRAIEASATPARHDRLFPGDIEQFAAPSGGLCLATGASGVLYAVAEAGQQVAPGHIEWLLARTARPVPGARLGLYDGMTGVAWTLNRLGHPAAAIRVAGTCLDERWELLGTDLYGGLTGVALALLELGDDAGEPGLHEAGRRAADIVADRVPELCTADPGRRQAGLLHGLSGAALLLIRMFERTGDRAYLDLAAQALSADLDRCVRSDRGALQVDEGWRVMPYLGSGSAGIGLVIDHYLAHRENSRFRQAAAAIRVAACSVYYAQAGLLRGRAGLLLYLASSGRASGGVALERQVAAHVRRLAWHAIGYRGGFAFPGDSLFRLSMDLSTGAAGVLLSLAAALSPAGTALPCHRRPQRQAGRLDPGGSHTDVPGDPRRGLGKQSVTTRSN